MKRQASLILALACRPKYLLLDEAFDGLDPVMRLALKQLISDELISRQLTVIISSHNIRELEDICDEITLIQNGTINLSGDIAMIRNAYHKYQLAFYEPASAEMFHAIPYIDLELNSKFVVIIVKSEIDITALEALCPLIMEELPMSLEEIFVYEMKEHGYGRNI
ncbi:ABC transporter ATP-binding protein YtrB [bioreactor metagenome]|uniref:ABC transporter ATP-binding protein YtrB n=1 Tax=bioreactor metagenome TaxID=1076179 RepID=A0A645EFU9_9ZZZZ